MITVIILGASLHSFLLLLLLTACVYVFDLTVDEIEDFGVHDLHDILEDLHDALIPVRLLSLQYLFIHFYSFD